MEELSLTISAYNTKIKKSGFFGGKSKNSDVYVFAIITAEIDGKIGHIEVGETEMVREDSKINWEKAIPFHYSLNGNPLLTVSIYRRRLDNSKDGKKSRKMLGYVTSQVIPLLQVPMKGKTDTYIRIKRLEDGGIITLKAEKMLSQNSALTTSSVVTPRDFYGADNGSVKTSETARSSFSEAQGREDDDLSSKNGKSVFPLIDPDADNIFQLSLRAKDLNVNGNIAAVVRNDDNSFCEETELVLNTSNPVWTALFTFGYSEKDKMKALKIKLIESRRNRKKKGFRTLCSTHQ